MYNKWVHTWYYIHIFMNSNLVFYDQLRAIEICIATPNSALYHFKKIIIHVFYQTTVSISTTSKTEFGKIWKKHCDFSHCIVIFLI